MINLSYGYSSPAETARFEPGDVIHHKRFNYRGVIVDFDSTCRAPDDWYQANQTQPNRNQPWYHVLVDGKEPVVHGMINLFFSGYDQTNSKYIRNDTPWNPGQPPDAPPTPPYSFQ